MALENTEVQGRIQRYCDRFSLKAKVQLGFGFDGIVMTTGEAAIKGLRYQKLYLKEKAVYERLEAKGVREVEGFRVPKFLRSDDELWVIEMSIVAPPFVLDFAGASLDVRPDFPDDVWEEWLADKQEQFGERWSRVESIMAVFRGMGIYLSDVKPGNIEFDPEEP